MSTLGVPLTRTWVAVVPRGWLPADVFNSVTSASSRSSPLNSRFLFFARLAADNGADTTTSSGAVDVAITGADAVVV